MSKLAVAGAFALLVVAALSLPDGGTPDAASAAAPAALLHVVQNGGVNGGSNRGGTVRVEGPGRDRVECVEGFYINEATCRFESFAVGDRVTLTATAVAEGVAFEGWSDERCPAGTVPTCVLTLAEEQTVVALFSPLPIEVSTAGAGAVDVIDAAGRSCRAAGFSNPGDPQKCGTFALSAALRLVASGLRPRFNPGDCEVVEEGDNSSACTLTVIGTHQVGVGFGDEAPPANAPPKRKVIFRVRKTGSGSGTIRGSLDCGATCSVTHEFRKPVTLVADAAVGSRFAGWTGGCGTRSTCSLQATATAVTAEFVALPGPNRSTPRPVPPTPGAFRARVGEITAKGRRIRIPLGVNAPASVRAIVLKGRRRVATKLVALARGPSVLHVRVPRATKPGRYQLKLRIRARASSVSIPYDGKVRLR